MLPRPVESMYSTSDRSRMTLLHPLASASFTFSRMLDDSPTVSRPLSVRIVTPSRSVSRMSKPMGVSSVYRTSGSLNSDQYPGSERSKEPAPFCRYPLDGENVGKDYSP